MKSLEEELAADPATAEDVGVEEEEDGWGQEEEEWGQEAAAAAAPPPGSVAEKMAGKKSLRTDPSLGNKKKGGAGGARNAAPAEKPRSAMMYPMVFPGLFFDYSSYVLDSFPPQIIFPGFFSGLSSDYASLLHLFISSSSLSRPLFR